MSSHNSLKNYEFIKTIGEGTFGKVKLAVHKLTAEQVAIKILEKSKIKSKKDLERIEKEIKYMKNLNHPNIVKIYEIFENEDNFYISIEYVSGGELYC
jgi:serine/threonine protein kinase